MLENNHFSNASFWIFWTYPIEIEDVKKFLYTEIPDMCSSVYVLYMEPRPKYPPI